MNMTCPGCGFCGPLEIYASDVDARHFADLMGKVPPEIADLVIRYVGLFAPAKHKMTFSRGRRVLAELVTLIHAGKIERNRREWPAPISAWSTALAYMLEHRAQLTLPIKSHGYLLEVMVGQADKIEAQAEAAREKQRRESATPPPPTPVATTPRESAAERMARIRREAEARDAQQATAPDHTAQPAPPRESLADRLARIAAEQEIEQRRQRAGDPVRLSDVVPVPQRGNPQ